MTRKERIIEPVFTSKELELIKNKGLKKEDERKLILQAQRLDDLCVEQQKGSTYLEDKLSIGKTTIQNYRKGINFISEAFICSLSKEFDVSEDYLRGNADVKKIENEKINELLGLNDNSIKNLGFVKNKEYLNLLFDSNPELLNKDVFEIEEFINKKKNDGISLEDIVDLIDSNPFVIDEE